MFSKACEYAIRACIYIASESMDGNRVSLVSVAEKIESPEAFTSKILQKLVKKKIIQSIKGPGGGFEISIKDTASTSLLSIIEAIDGKVLDQCSLGLNECSEKNPCPFHTKYKPIKDKLLHTLHTTTLKELTQKYVNQGAFLKL
jgi:Rrf2 family transcriptional regulator, iron-sulfur cluster assembly transcription factor